MEKPQLLLETEEVEKFEEKSIPKRIILWTFKNFKFILLPGSRLEELAYRESEFERIVSKRNILRRLTNLLTILGFSIILFITTLAVFAPWIAPQSFADAMDTHAGS